MNKMFICFLQVFACVMSLFLGACSEDDAAEAPYLKISKEELIFGKHEGETLLYIQSNAAYEVISDAADWCTVVQQASTSQKTAKYLVHVTENPATENRTAVISIKGAEISGTVKVQQTANDLLQIEQRDYTLPGEGGEFSVQMQTTGDCQVTIGADWIKRVESRSVESRTMTFVANQNASGEKRTATISFTLDNLTESVTVTQEAISIPEADKTGMEHDAAELMKNIKIGWNLGNSLEATGSETAWGNPATTLAMINKISEMGFNAVRIPCAWNQYLSDESTYEIKTSWLQRVKEVVDYCIQNNLYVILNIHWDGGWLENDIPNGYSETVNTKQSVLWKQIATYFRDYDEHLIFAGCNEPNVENADDMSVLLKYEQTFVDAVRATGGKNVYRNLIVQGPATDIDKTMQYMNTLPVDATPNRLSVEVHYYSSWKFCGMEKDESWGKAFYFWGAENKKYATGTYEGRWDNTCGEDYIQAQFKKLKERFTDKGIPVVIGEFAAIRRTLSDEQAQKGHDLSRAAFDKCVVREAKAHGLVPFYWDRGDGVLNRKSLTIYDELEYNGLMEGLK